jgi:nucleoside-diphosphate-sugar epimerase
MKAAFVTGGSGFIGGHLARALAAKGIVVRALGRSATALDRVRALGAAPVEGDLDQRDALRAGMTGCDVVFHCAGYLKDWDRETACRVNIGGTRNVLAAARAAGVKRVVYASGIGVIVGDGPAIDVDETRPRGRPVGVLCATRVQSEADVEAANSSSLETVIVRFPYVWGPGDTLRPALLRLIRAGRFRWIGGGRHLVSICHVADAVQGMILAASTGRPGAIYWIADDKPVELRAFIQAQLAVDGVSAPDRSVPLWLARLVADASSFVLELVGSKRPSPLTPTTVRFLGQATTVDATCARTEIGFRPIARWPEALVTLRPLSQQEDHDEPAAHA